MTSNPCSQMLGLLLALAAQLGYGLILDLLSCTMCIYNSKSDW